MSESDMIGDTAVDNVNMDETKPETEGDTMNETTGETEQSSSSPKTESGETDKKDTITTDTPPAPAAGETPHDDDDEFEYETEVRRTVIKKTMKITETTSTTKTTPLSTGPIGIEKLYGKDLSEYDDIDVDTLLSQLSPEEINLLAKEVDPDDSFLPPNQRCSYDCEKTPTGPLNRKKLIEHINKQAIEEPDVPEFEPYVKGTVRGKKWIPPPQSQREMDAEEQIAIDMGEEYEHALSSASQEEIIDLAAILGFHSMMNQDQYHASLLNKGQPVGLGWDGITKSQTQKVYPMDPPNQTDVEESIKRVKDDDSKLIELNMNNIKNISDEKLEQLFKALPENEHLEVLSLTNVGLTDRNALLLAEAIEKSKTLRVLNVETNFISPPVIVLLVKSLLKCRTVEEFRATNQRSSVLGNKIEMEITELVEKNNSLLRLGLHLEYNDARHRVAAHLQRNIDRSESSSNNHDTKGTTVTDKKPSASILALLTPNMASSSFDKSQTVDKSLFEMQDSSQSFINNNNNNNNTSNIVVEVNLMGGDNNPKSNNFSTITNDNNNKIYETSTTLHLSGKLNSNLNTSNTKTETISSIISTDSSTITTTTTNNFSSSDIIISNIDKLTTTIDQVAIADDIISTTLNTVNTDAMKISSIDKAHIEIKKNIDEKSIIEQTNILTDINSNNDENICSTIAETANSVQQQINISGENQMNEKEI